MSPGDGGTAMDSIKQAETLARLHFLDQMEVQAIDAALPKIEDPQLMTDLQQAREDHERHMRELDVLFGECGETVHPRIPNAFKTQACDRIEAIHAADDQEQAIRALLSAERAECDAYAAADAAKLPGDEGPVVHAHLVDEQHHTASITRTLYR
jgi:hypothetical protein